MALTLLVYTLRPCFFSSTVFLSNRDGAAFKLRSKLTKTVVVADKKALEEMKKKAAGKGPMNAGQQGIKKSGKK